MNKPSRRDFLQHSGMAVTAGLAAPVSFANFLSRLELTAVPASSLQTAPVVISNEGKKPLRLGLILGVEPDPDAAMAKLQNLGIASCQVYMEHNFEPAFAKTLRQSLDRANIEA